MGDFFETQDMLGRKLVGSPTTLIERLRQYELAWVNLIGMKRSDRGVPVLLSMRELIAKEVMQAFSGGPVAA